MSISTCPCCQVSLTRDEVANGWCPSCFKKLPDPAQQAAEAKWEQESSSPRTLRGEPIQWGYVIGVVLVIVVGLGMALFCLTGDFENVGPPATRRHKLLRDILGTTGIRVLVGVSFFGLACAGFYHAYLIIGKLRGKD